MSAVKLVWHFLERLEPLFAEQEAAIASPGGQPKDRRWTLQSALETLKARRRNEMTCKGAKFRADMAPNADQERLLHLLRTPPAPAGTRPVATATKFDFALQPLPVLASSVS